MYNASNLLSANLKEYDFVHVQHQFEQRINFKLLVVC